MYLIAVNFGFRILSLLAIIFTLFVGKITVQPPNPQENISQRPLISFLSHRVFCTSQLSKGESWQGDLRVLSILLYLKLCFTCSIDSLGTCGHVAASQTYCRCSVASNLTVLKEILSFFGKQKKKDTVKIVPKWMAFHTISCLMLWPYPHICV